MDGTNTAIGLDNSPWQWNLNRGKSTKGAHTHPISTEGNTDATWQIGNYPPYITVRYFIRVDPSTKQYTIQPQI